MALPISNDRRSAVGGTYIPVPRDWPVHGRTRGRMVHAPALGRGRVLVCLFIRPHAAAPWRPAPGGRQRRQDTDAQGRAVGATIDQCGPGRQCSYGGNDRRAPLPLTCRIRLAADIDDRFNADRLVTMSRQVAVSFWVSFHRP